MNWSFQGRNQKCFICIILKDLNYWKRVCKRVRIGSSTPPLFFFSHHYPHYSPRPLRGALCSADSTWLLQRASLWLGYNKRHLLKKWILTRGMKKSLELQSMTGLQTKKRLRYSDSIIIKKLSWVSICARCGIDSCLRDECITMLQWTMKDDNMQYNIKSNVSKSCQKICKKNSETSIFKIKNKVAKYFIAAFKIVIWNINLAKKCEMSNF